MEDQERISSRSLESPTCNKCGQCKWLYGERCVIGIICKNPDKKWRTKTSMWKYPHTKACKQFEEARTDGTEVKR